MNIKKILVSMAFIAVSASSIYAAELIEDVAQCLILSVSR